MLMQRLAAGLLSATLAAASGAAGAQEHVRLPDLGSSALAVLSPHEASQYGAQMLHQMRAMKMVLDDPLVNDYLNDVGYRLVAQSDDPSQTFTFFVVNTPVINAFAAPGGYIGVNAGLIDLTHSESELAAVMAHEIGHVTQHHLERAFEASKKDAPLMALVLLGAIAAGAADSGGHGYAYGYNGYGQSGGDAAMGVLAAGMGLIQQRQINFTRKDEIEADRNGIQTLAAAGYDPGAMAGFFQRMENALGGAGNDVPALLQTHPVTLNRIADAKSRARGLETRYSDRKIPPISRQQWEKITAPISYVSNPSELTAVHADADEGTSLYALMRERVRALSMDPGKAVDYYRRHLGDKHFDTTANRYGYALALTRHNEAGKAITQLQDAVKAHPDNLPLQLAMADAWAHDDKVDEALTRYARLDAANPHNRAIVQAWASTLIRDKSAEHGRKAAALIKPLLDDETDEPKMFEIYARASEIAGDKFNAAESWANVSYLEGRPFDAMEQLQRLLEDKSLNYYQRARVQADINQLRPLLLELQKRHIETPDRPRNGPPR